MRICLVGTTCVCLCVFKHKRRQQCHGGERFADFFFVLYCICLSSMFSDEPLGGWAWHVLMGRGWSICAYRMLIFAKLNQQLYSEDFALNYGRIFAGLSVLPLDAILTRR